MPQIEPVSKPYKLNDRQLIDELISRYASKYGVSAEVMHTVIKCESNYNPNALGDGGQSRGLVQIHRPSWPHITDDMAYDPEFAISFLAEKLSEGQGKLWTCWKMSHVIPNSTSTIN